MVYLVLDDLHWVDELSRELIDWLMEALRPARRMVMLAMFRPDCQVSGRWSGEGYAELALEPLDPPETTQMVEGMLKGLVLSDRLAGLIYQRSGGNPFYIEEIAYALIDSGVFLPDDQIQPGNRLWVVNPDEREVELPDSVHGMVQTRIDKLEEPARIVLFEAAVIGMEFGAQLLADLHGRSGGDQAELGGRLERLEQARLMVPSAGGGGDGRAFAFANVLIQQVAYNTLLNYNKQVLHGLVGECLERAFGGGEIPADEHHRLAFHFEKAELADRAIPYLQSAAGQLSTRFSNRAAIEAYRRLLELLGKSSRGKAELERLRLSVHFELAQLEYRVGELDQAYQLFAECCRRSGPLGDFELLCCALTRAGEIDRIRERPERARRFFEKSLELAERLGNDFYVADNQANLGILLEENGDYAGAMELFQRALSRVTDDEQRQNLSHYIFQRS